MGAKRRLFHCLFAAGLIGTAFLWGCGPQKDAAGGQKEQPSTLEGEPGAGAEGVPSGEADSGRIGDFTMEDIKGDAYTQDIFAKSQLTMVNVFATWCTPCVDEIPDLEKLKNEMADQGVSVLGIVLDAVDMAGSLDQEAVESARLLAEQLGVTYPFLIPDEGLLGGRLSGIDSVPTTFFVDREGKLVGEAYMGSRSLAEWKEIVEEKLSEIAK